MAIYTAGRRRTMLILLLTSILLITLDLRGNAVFNAARSGFGYAMRPFEIAGEVVTRPLARAWDGITRVDDLEAENQFLRDEIDKRSWAAVQAKAAIVENQELRDVLDIESLSAFDSRTCRIIGEGPSNTDQRVEIDCGSIDGVRVGMAVVNGAGLVGKVTNAQLETSFVMLVTDPQYHVTAKVIAEVDPAPTTTVADTVPSGLEVDDVTTTSSTTTSTSLAPEEGDTEGADGDEQAEAVTTSTLPASTTSTTLVLETRETGTLDGFGGERLPRVSFVADSPLFGRPVVGDAVLTAGGSESLAPPDIPIGFVANVITGGGVEGLQLEVDLNADLDRLNVLTVILYVPPGEADGLR